MEIFKKIKILQTIKLKENKINNDTNKENETEDNKEEIEQITSEGELNASANSE